MRITPGMSADNAVYNLQQGRANLNSLQEKLSSMLNVNKPSDDPLTARQLMTLQNEIDAGSQHASNITKGSLVLNVTNTALGGMADIMTQAKTAAGAMVSGTTDATAKASAISNLTQLKAQLIDLGNTQLGNQYIFAGFKNSKPFDTATAAIPGTSPALSTETGTFSGTSDALNVEIAPGSQVATNVSGGDLLRGGTPPAAVGSGATAGTSPVDILGSIDALIKAISTGDTTGIQDGIKNMAAASDQVTSAETSVAGRLTRLTNAQSMITNNQNTLSGAYSDKQNVDLAKTGVELSLMTTAFNASLSATAKVTQLTLLDYMK
jgi:flagellar hook-associated protein 3 FlgL